MGNLANVNQLERVCVLLKLSVVKDQLFGFISNSSCSFINCSKNELP